MKIILALLVILPVALSAVTIIDLSISNEIPEFRKDNDYLYPVKSSDHNFDGIAGSPVIPVRAVFFQIPADFQLKSVSVETGDQIEVFLTNPLYPQQKNQPLSIPAREEFTQPDQEYYSDSFYPSELIFSTGSGMTGSAGIGYVSFYCGQYNAVNSILKIPSELKFKVELEQHQQAILPDNGISELILGNFGITDREDFSEGSGNYLLITGAEFLEDYHDLLNWRYCQGWNVFSVTVDEIEQTVNGSDLQEKIRNYILDCVQQESITHVTLAGDTDLLPDRKFFAFDCEYGSYQDENEIPSDMYYSCLNGNWDANGNGIYGEEEDEPDYFPDVVVSRISAPTGIEVQDYIQRLIAYESGSLTDYLKAGGLSMELWEGSNSEICQQYIYTNYFPGEYQINLVYGEDNTTENAYQLLNQNMNIVQHTGHAGKYSIALENGHINNQNIDQLENDWGGMFYSIGCWSAALDYDSIGENLVVTPGKGQLAYIGNSRYGWGAPSAPGFGFSEFYQKTFFENMFWDGINSPANGNALQKIPYIPFFQGTSVYKWVAYELNAVTDSGFRLSNQEPLDVDYQSCFTPEGLFLQFSVEGLPLRDLLLTAGDHQLYSDNDGTIQLDNELLTENIVTYKYGYKSLFMDIADLVSEPAIVVISGVSETGYHQGEDLEIVTSLINPGDNAISYRIQWQYDPAELTVSYSEDYGYCPPGEYSQIQVQNVHIPRINESFQMKDTHVIYLEAKVFDQESDSLITRKAIPIIINAPEPEVAFFDPEQSDDYSVKIDFTVCNNGSTSANNLSFYYHTNTVGVGIEKEQDILNQNLAPGESIDLENRLMLSPDIDPEMIRFSIRMISQQGSSDLVFDKLVLIPLASLDFVDDFETEENYWQGDSAWQRIDYFSNSSAHSFSCRPQMVGEYQVQSPDFLYYPGCQLAFCYKYKMPMYGEDGFYLLLETDTQSDTLIFLGAGGALSPQRRLIEAYIESDWHQYQLDLDDVLLNDPADGTVFNLKLKFNFAEEFAGFNQYSLQPEIGVFLDDLQLNYQPLIEQPGSDDIQPDRVSFYPNPFHENLNIFFNLAENEHMKAAIYNLKGQKIREFRSNVALPVQHFIWDGRDSSGNLVDSGLYLLKAETLKVETFRKIIYLK